MDSAAESGQRMIGMADLAVIPRRSACRDRSRSAPRRDGSWTGRQEPARQDGEEGADEIGERRRALESSEYVRGNQGSLERYGGLQRVVLLMPEGGQLINVGIGRGFVFSVVSQKTAARYAVHRSKLPVPIMVAGPANQQVRATDHCTMAFPQERFLCNVEPDKIAGLRETRKHHVRIVLQNGERWYLNLLVSETARQSRITSAAAAKLGRGSMHNKRMHL